MAKTTKNKEVKGGNGSVKIPVEELEVGVTYYNYVKDLVKVTIIDESTKMVTLFNITGAFTQRVDFKNINLIQKVR